MQGEADLNTLLASVVSKRLSVESIGVNPVSGYFHDHLFVPLDKAERAMEVLEELSMR